jgi:hypothetical protein
VIRISEKTIVKLNCIQRCGIYSDCLLNNSARDGDVFKQHCSGTESKGMDKKPAAGICHNYNSGGYKKPVKPEAEKEKESSAALDAPIAPISVVVIRCDKDFHGFSLPQLSYP